MSEKLAGALIVLFLAQTYLAIAYYLWSRKVRKQRGDDQGIGDAEIEERFHRYAARMPEYPVEENDPRWLAPFEGYINGYDACDPKDRHRDEYEQ